METNILTPWLRIKKKRGEKNKKSEETEKTKCKPKQDYINDYNKCRRSEHVNYKTSQL